MLINKILFVCPEKALSGDVVLQMESKATLFLYVYMYVYTVFLYVYIQNKCYNYDGWNNENQSVCKILLNSGSAVRI